MSEGMQKAAYLYDQLYFTCSMALPRTQAAMQCNNSDRTYKNNRQMEMQSKLEYKSNQELNKLAQLEPTNPSIGGN